MRELSLRELQLFTLDILKDVHTFCINNQLHYSVAFGTLIGAIRHRGFIPWDDDIDIVMPRPDYERFCQTYHSERFHLKHRGNDKKCMITCARVYDNQKTMAQDVIPWCKESTGIWIDVFPIDGAPISQQEQQQQFDKAKKLWNKVIKVRKTKAAHLSRKISVLHNYRLLNRKMRFLNGHILNHLLDKQESIMRKVPYGTTPFCMHLSVLDANHPEVVKTDSMNRYVLKPFEDTEVMVMEDYDEILRITYGDYMQLPPEEDRVGHSTQGQIKYFWKD